MTGTGPGAGTGTGLGAGSRTGTGAGTGTRVNAAMSTTAGMGARTGAGTRTRIEMRVEGRESLRTYEGVIEVGRNMRERRRHLRVTNSDICKTRRTSETVPSCERPEPRDER